MRKDLNRYEVIKEFILRLDGFKETIRGRVMKSLDEDGSDFIYSWEVSHYYLPDVDSIGLYIPSKRAGKSYEDCKNSMFLYLNSITNIRIEKNEYY